MLWHTPGKAQSLQPIWDCWDIKLYLSEGVAVVKRRGAMRGTMTRRTKPIHGRSVVPKVPRLGNSAHDLNFRQLSHDLDRKLDGPLRYGLEWTFLPHPVLQTLYFSVKVPPAEPSLTGIDLSTPLRPSHNGMRRYAYLPVFGCLAVAAQPIL
jgi:hypothetical protein